MILCEDGDSVMDAFAGSATTAHAVLESDMKLSFILIEMMDYANSITAERVKRVIEGYSDGKTRVEGVDGGFKYYELGDKLFTDDEQLNPDIDEKKLREYIWYIETKSDKPVENNNYYLGNANDQGYYFFYEKDKICVLDYSFLSQIKERMTGYVIYADKCQLSEGELLKYNITFKKIPRDITRL